MKLHVHGAAGDVTGAAFQLTTEQASVLVDCGLYQGSRQTAAKNLVIPRLARPQLILTHGEDRARQALARRIEAEHGILARCPGLGDTIEV